jgi:hypothetical protein
MSALALVATAMAVYEWVFRTHERKHAQKLFDQEDSEK